MNKSQKYFDPETLARIGPLGLRARTLVEGLVSGLHRSPLRGHSIEFAQHREYAPGDDLRQLESDVLEGFRQRVEAERISRTESQRLYLAAIRQICRFVRAERTPGYPDTSASQSNDGFSA